MCGIVAVVGAITQPEREAFIELLHYDAVRGWDSTGVFNVMPDGSVDSYKLAEVPTQFMRRSGATRVVGRVGVKALVGHNRAATKGAVTDENAHPFHHDNIIGVHNGTLRNQHILPQSTKFVVDSDNLFHAMSNEDVRTLMPKVNGAFALVWHDSQEAGSVYVLRNSERPLWYAKNEAGTVVFMASEYQHIAAATNNGRVKIKLQANENGHTYFQFPENKLFKVRFDGVVEEVCAVPVYTFQSTYSQGSYYSGRGYDYDDYGAEADWRQSRKTTSPYAEREAALIKASGLKTGYDYLFVYESFTKYSGTNVLTGTLTGYHVDTGTTVVVYGVHAKDADTIRDTGSFDCKVTGAPTHANKDWSEGGTVSVRVTGSNPKAAAMVWKKGCLIEDGKVIELDYFTSEPEWPWVLSDTLKLGDTYTAPKTTTLCLVQANAST